MSIVNILLTWFVKRRYWSIIFWRTIVILHVVFDRTINITVPKFPWLSHLGVSFRSVLLKETLAMPYPYKDSPPRHYKYFRRKKEKKKKKKKKRKERKKEKEKMTNLARSRRKSEIWCKSTNHNLKHLSFYDGCNCNKHRGKGHRNRAVAWLYFRVGKTMALSY